MFSHFHVVFLLLLFPQILVSAIKFHKIFSLRADHNEEINKELKIFYYPQTLDHFNFNPESYVKFQQKYVIDFRFWGGPTKNAPIFAYLGAESPLDYLPGFLSDAASEFQALIVYIEHRFYGESNPGGKMQKTLKNATLRGYFNSGQALADYAEIILKIKETYKAHDSPVIVFGGSYGGMLASWFRLKYPHVALGALASSAPILYFDNIIPQTSGYYTVATQDFKETSETCYKSIRDSWAKIDKVASNPNGLATLSKKFKTCKPLTDSSELKLYLDDIFATAAQYGLPPISKVCKIMDANNTDRDILSKLFAVVVLYKEDYIGGATHPCYINNQSKSEDQLETELGYAWQTCSEMVMPIGGGGNATMFPNDKPFNLTSFIDHCRKTYGVSPRPHWITSYYGGHDIRLVLKRFGSNIIFSNGLKDPYSSGG